MLPTVNSSEGGPPSNRTDDAKPAVFRQDDYSSREGTLGGGANGRHELGKKNPSSQEISDRFRPGEISYLHPESFAWLIVGKFKVVCPFHPVGKLPPGATKTPVRNKSN